MTRRASACMYTSNGTSRMQSRRDRRAEAEYAALGARRVDPEKARAHRVNRKRWGH